jgi:hypothetical protein
MYQNKKRELLSYALNNLYLSKRPINRLPTNPTILLLLLLLLFRAWRERPVRLLLLSHTTTHRRITSLTRIRWRSIGKGAMVC